MVVLGVIWEISCFVVFALESMHCWEKFLEFVKLVGNKIEGNMSVDFIGNFLTTLRNALRVSKREILSPHSKMNEGISKVLHEEGYIKGYSVEEKEGKRFLRVELKYKKGESVIHAITRVSSPGKRIYRKSSELVPVAGRLGISLLTTNRGLMTDRVARKEMVGGEVICKVW